MEVVREIVLLQRTTAIVRVCMIFIAYGEYMI